MVSETLRLAVAERANGRCEYCGKPQVSFFPHEVDHVIARKHRGKTDLENLAFSCFECNRYKGSDVASYDPETNQLTPLFNPRADNWRDHFQYDNGYIVPHTPRGRVTVMLLRLNEPSRLAERIALHVGVS